MKKWWRIVEEELERLENYKDTNVLEEKIMLLILELI
jgi:hypothetical protein